MNRLLRISILIILLFSCSCGGVENKTDDPITPNSITITSVTISPCSRELVIGNRLQLSAMVNPSNATYKTIIWSSSNPDVATVTPDGLVNALNIGTTLIECNISGIGATCEITVTEDSPKVVDLGLSVKWANRNVGANKPKDYGNYYAWGEITSKRYYGWNTYKWCGGESYNQKKYNNKIIYGIQDKLTILELSDDAARENWGGKWRMPTWEEFMELMYDCTWTWNWEDRGYTITSKKNGNSIFMPCAGYRSLSSVYNSGSYGYYWSSSLDILYCDHAEYCRFYQNSPRAGIWADCQRCTGLSIRPVTE